LSSLRQTPGGVDFINICGHFSKVVTKSDSWKKIFKNYPDYSLTERYEDKQTNYLRISGHEFSPGNGFFRETLLIPERIRLRKNRSGTGRYTTTKPIPAALLLKNMVSPGKVNRYILLRVI